LLAPLRCLRRPASNDPASALGARRASPLRFSATKRAIRKPNRPFGYCRPAGVWRRLGASAGSFIAANLAGARFRIRLAGLGGAWPGSSCASRRRSWDFPLRSFCPAGRLAGLLAAATHLSFRQPPTSSVFDEGSSVISIYVCDARSELADRDSWAFRPASRAARSRSWAAAAVGFASSRFSDALVRSGRVSSPWPAIDSENRFRFH